MPTAIIENQVLSIHFSERDWNEDGQLVFYKEKDLFVPEFTAATPPGVSKRLPMKINGKKLDVIVCDDHSTIDQSMLRTNGTEDIRHTRLCVLNDGVIPTVNQYMTLSYRVKNNKSRELEFLILEKKV